jgi:SAM-dependent methyltransferase
MIPSTILRHQLFSLGTLASDDGMKLFSFLESNAAAYEFSQRLVSFNFRAFLRELRAEQFFQTGLSYLDLGCGTGFLRDHLRNADYLGVDLNPAYIAAARRKRGECFQVGDALEIGNLSRQFDRIIAIGLLHHLDDRQVRTVLAGARQRLRPGGEIFIIDALWPPDNNRLGRILRGSDNGAYVRTLAEWEKLFAVELKFHRLRPFAQWPCDYVFLRAAETTASIQ